MYDTILVPTDGSEHSVRAAEHGGYLAGLFDATLRAVAVVDVQGAAGPFSAGGVDEQFVERLEATAEEALDAVEAAVGGRTGVETELLEGEPSTAILEDAADHDVDLLVMGTHGRTGLGRFLTGSVTEHVVRRSDVPVLTVRATERSRVDADYDEVLVPTDGSESATAAVDHGLAIARSAGARVHAVNVVDVGAIAADPSDTPPTELIEYLESSGETATDRIVTRARKAGLDAVGEVREGFPAWALLEYADEHDVDLIAMGTHGRTGLDRFLLGSTTERLVRRAEAPVLAVNAGRK